jgi:hypothetical protein
LSVCCLFLVCTANRLFSGCKMSKERFCWLCDNITDMRALCNSEQPYIPNRHSLESGSHRMPRYIVYPLTIVCWPILFSHNLLRLLENPSGATKSRPVTKQDPVSIIVVYLYIDCFCRSPFTGTSDARPMDVYTGRWSVLKSLRSTQTVSNSRFPFLNVVLCGYG